MKLTIIGLDTSHSIAFTKLIQGDAPESEKIDGLEIISCMRFPSAFNSEESQDERQKQLEQWGVKVTRSFDEAVQGAEALLLEINDPALHLQYFEKAAKLNKPLFLDKPLAGNIEDGKKIVQIAKENNIKVWSSSSLRFTNEIKKAISETPQPILCNVFGPMGKAPAGSSLIWYGVHSFEMLATIMGKGAKNVLSHKDKHGIVSIVNYSDGRRGIVECNENSWLYGGRVQSEEKVSPFIVDTSVSVYRNLLLKIKEFFLNCDKPDITKYIPVDMDETLEILAMMTAAEKSLENGRQVDV